MGRSVAVPMGVLKGVRTLGLACDYRFQIPSFTTPGKTYVADVAAGFCSCPHHRLRSVFCKHLCLANEVATYERLVHDLRLAERVVAKEKRAASGFRSGVSSESLEAATAANDALRTFVEARIVRGCFVPGMPEREAQARKEVAA